MEHPPYADDVATGEPRQKLRIAGRPREGSSEKMVVMEEPGEPVLMHYAGKLVPHFKRDCPNCTPNEEPKPLWYVGASTFANELVIMELTGKCFYNLAASARSVAPVAEGLDLFGDEIRKISFVGLVVTISRANFKRSPRVIRCEQRTALKSEWPYRTREELARVWGVALRPRLWRESGA